MDNSNGSLYNMKNGPPYGGFPRGPTTNNLTSSTQGPPSESEGPSPHARPGNYQSYPSHGYGEMDFSQYPASYAQPAYSSGHPMTPSYHQQQQQHFPTNRAYPYHPGPPPGSEGGGPMPPHGPGNMYSSSAHAYTSGGMPVNARAPSQTYRESAPSSQAFRFPPDYPYRSAMGPGPGPSSSSSSGNNAYLGQGPMHSFTRRPSPEGGAGGHSPNGPAGGGAYNLPRGPSPSSAGATPTGGPMTRPPHPSAPSPYPPTMMMPNRPPGGPGPAGGRGGVPAMRTASHGSHNGNPPTDSSSSSSHPLGGPPPSSSTPGIATGPPPIKKEENIQGFKSKAQEMKRKYLNKLEQMIKNMEDIKPSAKTEETKYKYDEIQKKLTLLRTLITADFKPNSNFPPRREILDAAEKQIIMWIKQWEKLERTGPAGTDSGVTIDTDSLDEMINQRFKSEAGAQAHAGGPGGLDGASLDGLDDLGLDTDLQSLFSDDFFGESMGASPYPPRSPPSSSTPHPPPPSSYDGAGGDFLGEGPSSSHASSHGQGRGPGEAEGEGDALGDFFPSVEGSFPPSAFESEASSWDSMGDGDAFAFVGQKRYREDGMHGHEDLSLDPGLLQSGKRDSRSSSHHPPPH